MKTRKIIDDNASYVPKNHRVTKIGVVEKMDDGNWTALAHRVFVPLNKTKATKLPKFLR